MGLFDFFKGKKKEEKKTTRDKYWSLTTYEGEVVDPTMEQIETAVRNANSGRSLFATLAYINSELDIESVQAISDQGLYRFEALTDDGILYVKKDLNLKETIEKFDHFYKYQSVTGYKSWPIEKY